MAEALVSIAAEGILKKVLSIAVGELAITLGYEEKLTTLHNTLDLIRAKLSDAESKKGTQAVMVWLKQLKDVVGKADDVLDEVQYEMLRRQVEKRDQTEKIIPSLPSLKKLSFRRKMGHKIENINKMLLEINTQANGLGLHNEHPGDSTPDRLMWKETVPHLDKSTIVGRDDDKLRIIELLSQSTNKEKLTIVPVVGMGGIGKTTLAKSVYNDKIIEKRFNVKAWLCVSVKIDINTLLAKIYESFTKKKPTSDLKVNLIKSLEEELESKRYLLVLDDVWVEERPYWEDFTNCMLNVNSQNGSGILVTTRKLQIGTHDMIMNSCRLKGLSNNVCWSIFEERAFLAGEKVSSELVEIGREIVKKCGGLPLLLNVIGGMLANDRNKNKWLSIKSSQVWELEDEKERVEKSLKLSFDNLPNSMVKQCFVYCSIFKKDKVMKREKLVQLWIALGLVQADEQKNKDMEDVGNDIFQILVSNSLFQGVKVDRKGEVIGCSMHDLVHDVLLSLSKHESLRLVDATNDDVACIPKVKHLSLYQKEYEDYENRTKVYLPIEGHMTAKTLHTFFFMGEVKKKFSFQRFKCMRILKLKGFIIEKIDDSIGELVHLRYLDLSSTVISVLPGSIGKLYHLQTLNLYHCYNLTKFPISMRNLISLRCCKFHDSIPVHIIGHLTCLRTLEYFKVGPEKGNQIEELGHLKHLGGKLNILDLENVSSKEDAVKADLSGKKNLREITFKWSSYESGVNKKDKDVLEGLQPPSDLEFLSISEFSGDDFPEWVMKMAINIDGKWSPLDKLMKITLYVCRGCRSLPTLDHLPHLQNLVLENMDNLTCLKSSVRECENVTVSMKPVSPSLRYLRLISMPRLEKWIDGETNSSGMISPVLDELEIMHCPRIILLDESHPHPLASLYIRNCNNLVSIKSIQGLTSLKYFMIGLCRGFSGITTLPNPCPSLKKLQIIDCKQTDFIFSGDI
ncbi:hypothetical protein LXL04_000037 [Taraxacum kok-saghyz]